MKYSILFVLPLLFLETADARRVVVRDRFELSEEENFQVRRNRFLERRAERRSLNAIRLEQTPVQEYREPVEQAEQVEQTGQVEQVEVSGEPAVPVVETPVQQQAQPEPVQQPVQQNEPVQARAPAQAADPSSCVATNKPSARCEQAFHQTFALMFVGYCRLENHGYTRGTFNARRDQGCLRLRCLETELVGLIDGQGCTDEIKDWFNTITEFDYSAEQCVTRPNTTNSLNHCEL